MSQTKIKKAKRGEGEDMKNMNQVMSKTKANLTLEWCSGLITEHSAHAQTHKHAHKGFGYREVAPMQKVIKGLTINTSPRKLDYTHARARVHAHTHTAACDKKNHRGHTSLITVHYDFRTND